MSTSAVALAIVTLALDHSFRFRWLDDSAFAVGPEGPRLVLSSIAGSMITVASLVFSMTLMTLTLASSQLGPLDAALAARSEQAGAAGTP